MTHSTDSIRPTHPDPARAGTTTVPAHVSLREPATARTGRPWALLWLWLALMAPLSIAGRLLQPVSGIDDRALPLVMVGPAVAWAICRLVVPRWFPADAPRLRAGLLWRPTLATVIAAVGFVAALWSVGGGGPMILPDGPVPLAIGAVILGMLAGSWCEEVGYRGVMYRAMASRWGTVPTIFVNGLVFGLAHLQYFAGGPGPVLLFLAFTMLLDLAMAATWEGSWHQRVLVATLLHAALNVAMQLRGLGFGGISDFVAVLVATVVCAGLAIVAGRALRVGDLRGAPNSPATA